MAGTFETPLILPHADSYLRAVDTLCRLIESHGKKAYTVVVGKLNVAKLANFPEMDAFVLVASPDNTVIDSKEFFKPVITPFELHLALSRCFTLSLLIAHFCPCGCSW